ncbi:hypothetical protein J3R83DRAFT_1963 [Lanmaoa asiatica]|nr:hypothetical protein J3R83DRAFT_1963 [Lanmaoa asiatica]
MSTTDSPLHIAHQHTANAEDFLNEGLLIPAAEEHAKAAKAFLQCEEKSNDNNTKRTLRMLYNEHIKAGRDLERRIAKLREENNDPTLPQKISLAQMRAERSSSSSASSGGPHPSYPTPSPPPPPSASLRLMDSQNNVDESFMVLGQRSDPGDAFNHFWRIMEGMLDNLSQPVAFTTAPLGTEPGLSGKRGLFSRKLGLEGRPKSKQNTVLEETDEEVFADEDDDLSGSFCLIPSESEPATSVLTKENVSLKQEIEEMQRRLAEAERVLHLRKEQDQLLRDSIVMARHQVGPISSPRLLHRIHTVNPVSQAQRAMGASLVLQRPGGQQPAVDLGALNINVPSVLGPMTALNAGRDREAQLSRRIRDLEEELRATRVENDKQKAVIVRFRERWEKLKESAKRKKDAKATSDTTKIGVRERIEEEPEAERELDEAGRA